LHVNTNLVYLQINAFRTLRQDMPENPQALMYNNVRPVQLLNQRTVRTNINFVSAQNTTP